MIFTEMIIKQSHASQDHFRTLKSERPIIKYYFTTPEVSEILGEVQSTIRFWSKAFGLYRKWKGYKKHWVFPRESLAKLHHIKRLLREEHFTIEGAKLKLKLIEK